MIQALSDNQDILRQLVEAARRSPTSPALLLGEQASQAGDYDWSSPHRFEKPMLEQLRSAGHKLAARVSKDLQSVLRSDLALELAGLVEHYAWHLGATLVGGGGHALEMTLDDGQVCGFVLLSEIKAIALVEKMLGGSAAPEGPRKLSPLESALLIDLLAALAKSVEAGLREVGLALRVSPKGRPAGEVLPREGCDEYCRMSLRAPKESGEPLNVVFLSQVIASGEEAAGQKQQGGQTPERARQIMLAHLQMMPVRAVAVLGTAFAYFGEVLALQPGDVLVLDRQVDDLVELRVGSSVALHGQAVTASGCYALRVAPPPAGPR